MKLSPSFVAAACLLNIVPLVHATPVPVDSHDVSPESEPLPPLENHHYLVIPPPANGGVTPGRPPQRKRRVNGPFIPQPPYPAETLFRPMNPYLAHTISSEHIRSWSATDQTGGRTAQTLSNREELEAPWRKTVHEFFSLSGLVVDVKPGVYRPPTILDPKSMVEGLSTPERNMKVPLDMKTFSGHIFQVLDLGVLGKKLKNLQTVGENGDWIRFRGKWYLAPGWYDLVKSQVV